MSFYLTGKIPITTDIAIAIKIIITMAIKPIAIGTNFSQKGGYERRVDDAFL
jgi:hypothetical protein